ncbi:MAG TPA: hypothetical protein VGB77_04185 [Abditibacteriaceae bacterium]|jgi:hypothetical protein
MRAKGRVCIVFVSLAGAVSLGISQQVLTPAWGADCDCSAPAEAPGQPSGDKPASDQPEGDTPGGKKEPEQTVKTVTSKRSESETNFDSKTRTLNREITTETKEVSGPVAPAASGATANASASAPQKAPGSPAALKLSKFKNDTQEQVTLYYYSDVEGLMRYLNPAAQKPNAEAADAAKTEQKELAKKRGALIAAQLKVNTLQSSLQNLIDSQKRVPQNRDKALERWKAAQRDVQSKTRTFDERKKALEAAQEAKDKADTAVTEAENALAEAPDEEKEAAQKELDKAKNVQKAAEKSLGTALENRDDAQCDLCFAQRASSDAQKQFEKLNKLAENPSDEANTILKALGDAQGEVETAKATLGQALADESAAFAASRDNPIALMARGDKDADQPNQRVDLFAYKDARTIFIRGERNDVQVVKDLIAKFDRPTPQARLGLLTLQLSSKSNSNGARSMNLAVQQIEEMLGATRARMALAQGILREVINEEVNKMALTNGHGVLYATAPDPAYLRRITFYNPEVVQRLGMVNSDASRVPFNELSAALILRANEIHTIKLDDVAKRLQADKTNFNTATNNMGLSQGTTNYVHRAIEDIAAKLNGAPDTQAQKGIADDLIALSRQLANPGVSWLRNNSQDGFRVAFLKANLPDPAGTTTLGESLLVLSLARRNTVAKIIDEFELRLKNAQIPTVEGEMPVHFPRGSHRFSQLRAVLGVSSGTGVPDDSLTAAQKEIVLALQRVGIGRVRTMVRHNAEQLHSIAAALRVSRYAERSDYEKLNPPNMAGQAGAVNHIKDQPLPRNLETTPPVPLTEQDLTWGTIEGQRRAQAILLSEAKQLVLETLVAIQWLSDEYNLPLIDKEFLDVDPILHFMQITPQTFASAEGMSMIERLSAEMDALWAPDVTNARIAAADEMLKRIIIAAEDDMDRNFVRPMVDDLINQVRRKGVAVGVMQRTQVLASNRLIARTEPRGTAQLALGRETDAILGAQTLLDLGKMGLGGATGVLGTAAAVTQGTLKIAKQLPPEKNPELYGLETGGSFTILPVIDPSGQALRFRFDYVLNTPVHDPKGTVNPQMPTLTQTTNTEVQLSNLEIRSIADFDATVQLGLTERYKGGIPILNDIPGIQKLPLIGWFNFTRGKAPIAQKSILVGQATIYPTIGDLTNLLTPLGPRRIGGAGDNKEASSGVESARSAAAEAKQYETMATTARKAAEEARDAIKGLKTKEEKQAKAQEAEARALEAKFAADEAQKASLRAATYEAESNVAHEAAQRALNEAANNVAQTTGDRARAEQIAATAARAVASNATALNAIKTAIGEAKTSAENAKNAQSGAETAAKTARTEADK